MNTKFASELYNLCCTNDNEYKENLVIDIGWMSDNVFCVWVSFSNFRDFYDGLNHILGISSFEHVLNLLLIEENTFCMSLSDYVNISELADIFPKEKYQH